MATGITTSTKDKYDVAVEYLRKHPERILNAWGAHQIFEGGCLFQHATPSGGRNTNRCGCPTTIRHPQLRKEVSGRPGLTEEIRNDDRLPSQSVDITVEHLPVFAEWQRRLDVELGRK